MNKFTGFLLAMRSRPELMVLVIMVLVIAMLVIPLPTILVDFLIGLNIMISVLIFMSSFYITRILNFQSFPSILLISTLFRLALSISTSRLILIEADAGDIIATFGEFVIQDNLVVGISFVEVVMYELAIGLVIALILALPFMIANVIGELIDTQRGETISSIVDPASGTEASELAVFISYIICMVFLSQGGMLVLAKTFAQSYQLLPFAAGFSQFNSLPLGEWMNQMVVKGVVLAAPILVTLFISEVALGLYSRFCPQLNAFSLSLAIKSFIAFTVFLLYFQNEVPDILVNMISISPLSEVFISPQ